MFSILQGADENEIAGKQKVKGKACGGEKDGIPELEWRVAQIGTRLVHLGWGVA